MIEQYSLSPDPTAIPEKTLLRRAQTMIHHRIAPEIGRLRRPDNKTKNNALMLAAFGSGAKGQAWLQKREGRVNTHFGVGAAVPNGANQGARNEIW